MQLNFKKLLLTGTALVAVTSFGAQAQAATQTLAGNVEWANAGTKVVGAGDGTTAVAGDDAVLSTFNLTVTNDGTNDDGSANKNTFALGTVTATTGDFVITEGSANLNTVTIGSFTSDAGGDFSVTGVDGFTGGITATVTNGATIGGNLSVVNGETNAADAVSLSVGGALSVTGTTAVTGGAGAFANPASLTVGGNATFTGAVTVTGGADATAPATLTLNGATNAFTAGLTLTKGAAGAANLKLSGTTAQTVSGNIGGTGVVTIDNASGATFSGTVAADSIVIEKTAGSSSATFQNTVTAPITLGGDGAAGTNTVTFDTTTQGFTVTGAIAGTAGETNNIVVSGGKTLVQATASTVGLTNLTVSGTGTILDSNANLTVTNTTIGSGATLDVGAGNLTSAVANSGTLLLSGAGDVIGNVTGTGTLDVNETTAVNGNISQGSITVAEGKAFTVEGGASRTVTGDITLEDAASDGSDAQMVFDNGANTTTFTGNIKTQIDGEGVVSFNDDAGATLALVGDVGTSALKVGTFNVLGGAAQTLTTTGNLYVNNILVDDADTLQFLGTAAQIVSGAITGGIITVGNGTTTSDVTFGGAVGSAASATVSANAFARLNANFTTDGAYTNNGSTYVGVGSTLTAASLGGTGTLYINMLDDGDGVAENDGSDSGLVVSAGAVDTSTGNLVINYTGTTVAGTYAGIVTGGGGTALDATVTDNSFQYGTTVVLNGTNYDLTVTRTSLADIGTTGNNTALGTMLETIATTTDPQISQAINNIASQSTQEGANEVMESMTPTVDGGHMVAAANVTNNAFGQMGDRLALLRSGEQTGMAAGNGTMGHRLWAQGFGSKAQQDRRDGVDGYDADTYGGTIGLDTETISDNGVVGVAFSYANTEVDSKNANTTNSDVDSYQIAVYGDYDLDQTMWLNGMAAYAWNDVSTTRHNVGGIAGLNANGDFDANQYTVQAEVGRDYTYDSMTVAPSFLAHWTHYDPDGYTETGAGGLNQVVDQDSVDIFELGVGVDASWQYETASGMEFVPSLHAGYRYDLVGDEVEATARFTGAGAAFTTQGADPARSAFNVGGAMKLYTTDNWEFSANYDFNFKSDYDAHAGYLRAGVKF